MTKIQEYREILSFFVIDLPLWLMGKLVNFLLSLLLRVWLRKLQPIDVIKIIFLFGILNILKDSRRQSKGEIWTRSLGWFIPRKYRNQIIGDILEDCAEMRQLGYTERRIKFQVVYQWIIAVIMLIPTAIKTSIIDAVKQVIGPPK